MVKNQTKRVQKVDRGDITKNLRNMDSSIITNLKKNKRAGF